MKKTIQLTDLLLGDIIPKLCGGQINGKGTILTAEECENVVKALSVSISIEPFMEVVATLPHKTLLARHKERFGDDENKPPAGE